MEVKCGTWKGDLAESSWRSWEDRVPGREEMGKDKGRKAAVRALRADRRFAVGVGSRPRGRKG